MTATSSSTLRRRLARITISISAVLQLGFLSFLPIGDRTRGEWQALLTLGSLWIPSLFAFIALRRSPKMAVAAVLFMAGAENRWTY